MDEKINYECKLTFEIVVTAFEKIRVDEATATDIMQSFPKLAEKEIRKSIRETFQESDVAVAVRFNGFEFTLEESEDQREEWVEE